MKKAKISKLKVILTSVTAVLLVIMLVGTYVAYSFSTVINVFFDVTPYEIIEDENGGAGNYFTSSFDSLEEMLDYEVYLCEQVEAEGATLLMNENNALPLSEGDKVSLFSHSSVDLIYGGTGSGKVNIDSAPTLLSALTDVGVEVNSTLWRFYESGRGKEYSRAVPPLAGGSLTEYKINEVPWSVYSTPVKNSFSEYGDAAIVVLSRSGGEGHDLPQTGGADGTNGDYLRLSAEEKEMMENLKALKAQGVFKKIVVLLNTSNHIQLDFLKNNDYDVDAVMWIGGVGQDGIKAVAKLLVGQVNPSGRLVDTLVYENSSIPALQNFAEYKFTNVDEYGHLGTRADSYVVYQEGIYIGYRYFETRYEDAVMGRAGVGDYSYEDTVAFPFGYGLSYTTFEYSNFKATENTDSFTFEVTVTNTGSVAGKHTVQIYFQSPYTQYDIDNGIEKASVELCGFDKTEILEPNQSETVTIEVSKSELRTYDANNAKTYILDAGDYYFSVGLSSHHALNNILAQKGYTVDNGMTEAGDASMVYKWNNPQLDTTTFAVSAYTGLPITNQFEYADLNKYEGAETTITYLSRNDWEGTWPETVQLAITEQMVADGLAISDDLLEQYRQAYVERYGEVTMPTTGASNGLTAASLIGKSYDDEMWDILLDQVTWDEMVALVGQGYHVTQPVPSISLPSTKDENGPQGLTASLTMGESAMAYTSEDIRAATYNVELVNKVGECIGEDCLEAGYSGLYGPGANVHRTPYSGRNFEYYSEDSFLSSVICDSEVKGIQSKGVYVFIKHFALNDQEEGRNGISTWANEQAIREIYIECYEKALANNQHAGVMTAFNRFGVRWSSHCEELMIDVLRNEFNMTGIALTDCCTSEPYMDVRLGVLCGTNLWDGSSQVYLGNIQNYSNDPVIVHAMRQATKQIIYNVVNSNAMNGISSNTKIVAITPWWQTALIAIDVSIAVVTAVCATALVLDIIKKRKQTV